jgi:hypothetical protein
MRQLVQLRAMLDAALAEHVAAFDTRAAARYDGQTSTTVLADGQPVTPGQARRLACDAGVVPVVRGARRGHRSRRRPAQ